MCMTAMSKGDSYHVNDMVFLHCTAIPRDLSCKFHKPWQGPYTVQIVCYTILYTLDITETPQERRGLGEGSSNIVDGVVKCWRQLVTKCFTPL